MRGSAHGEKAEDLSDFAGLLRSGDRRSVDESGSGSLGRRQQSLPSGCGQGERRSGRHRRDHEETGRRSQATRGSDGSFSEHAELPADLGDTDKPGTTASKSKGRRPKKAFSRPADKATERKAAAAYEREQKHRERERAREEAARQKERERRQQAVDKAQAAFDKAEGEHAKRAAAIQAEMDALEKKARAEDAD
jgi:hypothetical protein